MSKKLFTLSLLIALGCSLTVNSFAKHKKQPAPASEIAAADFDYFLLTLSWAPEFCASNPKGKSSTECDPKKHYGFVVHGLWPQNNTGAYPHDCAPAQPVSQAIVQQMM